MATDDPPPSCTNLTLGCGELLDASTEDCSGDIGSHSCFNKDATGPDRLHSLRLASDFSQVRISVNSPSDLDVYVYDFGLSSCINWGDTAADLFNVTAGERFWVVVDGGAGVMDDYTIQVECTP